MGCGSKRDLFRLIEYGIGSSHSFGNRYGGQSYASNNDIDNKLALLNKIYVSSLINDEEYLRYKQLVLSNSITFDDLVVLQRRKKQDNHPLNQKDETKKQLKTTKNSKIDDLKKSQEKIVQVVQQIDESIEALKKQKQKIEMLLQEYIKIDDKKAEEYISKKIDIEERVQNLNVDLHFNFS